MAGLLDGSQELCIVAGLHVVARDPHINLSPNLEKATFNKTLTSGTNHCGCDYGHLAGRAVLSVTKVILQGRVLICSTNLD